MDLFQCEIPTEVTAYLRWNQQVYVVVWYASTRGYKATMSKHYGQWKVAWRWFIASSLVIPAFSTRLLNPEKKWNADQVLLITQACLIAATIICRYVLPMNIATGTGQTQSFERQPPRHCGSWIYCSTCDRIGCKLVTQLGRECLSSGCAWTHGHSIFWIHLFACQIYR